MAQGEVMAVSAIGVDRPGIVAAVTKVLYDHGCNLEDATSTILRGHFSMTLIVRTSPTTDRDKLQEDLEAIGADLELMVSARLVDETSGAVAPPTHMISVYGADRPGIVYRVASALGELGANITDLTSRIIGEDDNPVYALMIEVQLPGDADADAALASLRQEPGLEVHVSPIEADVL
ncbi:MAG TPA: ACT domain-containing protein [Actinomycetota bacterium]|nr:ACT domain-containing protein [Actinomycetota bacterium]